MKASFRQVLTLTSKILKYTQKKNKKLPKAPKQPKPLPKNKPPQSPKNSNNKDTYGVNFPSVFF